ncbi:MAG: DUF1501 domain-containing protein [Isosphaeraceae bacterium]|nr:DUF1501 domain-containing protein [Isosphaeraceae bacterium]
MKPQLSRRDWLRRSAGGFGMLALVDLLARDGALGGQAGLDRSWKIEPIRVRRIIQLFMNGGVSQMDTFDYKPELEKRHDQPFDPGERVEAATSAPGKLMKSPFEFRRFGESGRWVSSVFPELAKRVDDLAFLMSVASKTNVHGPASYLMNTGFLLPGFPCFGAWVSHALGSERDNLPSFVVLPDPRGLPYNARGNFTAGFLPPDREGTVLDMSAPSPIPDLFADAEKSGTNHESIDPTSLMLLERQNRRHAATRSSDARLDARIATYELAARLQLSAPEALALDKESDAVRRLYGIDRPETADFGRRCLLARRLVERGVRFVQVWSGAGGPKDNWDNHSDIHTELPKIARSVDAPIAGLLHDLKSRGLLDDTLVVFSTEFGRMPFTQGATGRDHNGGTSIAWLAGAGIRAGVAHGASDDWSWRSREGRVDCHDLHATILHLMGIDHKRLTVRHNGIDRRLTDVHGRIIPEILDRDPGVTPRRAS